MKISDKRIYYKTLLTIEEEQLHARIQSTLSRFPLLTKLYTDEFCGALVRDRFGLDNYVLLLLVQPSGTWADEFWKSVVEDFTVLGLEESLAHFGARFHHSHQHQIMALKSEIEFAVRNKRAGFGITLLPDVPGQKRCEFVVDSDPKTWWEVKTVLDEDSLREDARAQEELERGLETIDEPFSLSLEIYDLKRSDVSAAVLEIKETVRNHFREAGRAKKRFHCYGVMVEAYPLRAEKSGYVGARLSKGYTFQNENIKRVLEKIRSAGRQLPKAAAGIVVIDMSLSTWLEQDDVEEASFGELALTFAGDQGFYTRSPLAVFKISAHTRVSAVVWYDRNRPDDDGSNMIAYHNPFAATTIPDEYFDRLGIPQVRREELPQNRLRLVKRGLQKMTLPAQI